MSTRAIFVVVALLSSSGCVTDHIIGLELRPPRLADGGLEIPPDVVAYEVRLYRLDAAEHCPDATSVAIASDVAELGQAQTFDRMTGMGEAIGDIPPGRWAVAALARDASCAVRLFGCSELDIGVATPATLEVELEAVSLDVGCGACRSCINGICDPVASVCH